MGGSSSKGPSPTPSPTRAPGYIRVGLTFYNAINDGNQYLLNIIDVKGNSWKTDYVPYGQSVQFFHDSPDPSTYTGLDYSAYAVSSLQTQAVASFGNIVASGKPLPIDNQNQLLVVVWNDAQGNIYSDLLGSYSSNSQRACIFGLNLRDQMPTESNAAMPFINLLIPRYDYDPRNSIADYSTVVSYTSTNKLQVNFNVFAGAPIAPTASYAKLNTYCTDAPTRSLFDLLYWRCGLPGTPNVTSGRTIGAATWSLGTNIFLFCLNNPSAAIGYVNPQRQSKSVTIPQAAASPQAAVSTAGSITTGFLKVAQYGDSGCQTTSQVTTFSALGQCAQTGLQTSLVRSATINGTVTTFMGTNYGSTTCDPSTAGNGMMGMGLDTTSVCQPNPLGNAFLTTTYTATLPPLPAGQLARYWYTDAATCAAGTAVPLQARYWAPQTCSAFFGNAYRQEMCAANVTLTSTTGGFVVYRFYGAAGCQATPLVTNFHQLNVCGQRTDSGSFMYVSKPKAPGSSVTAFQMVQYASNDCSGSPVPPTLSVVPTTYDVSSMASQGNATAPEGDTSMICAPSGYINSGMAYVTVLYTPVLAFASGWGVGRFNSLKGCNAMDTTRFFSGTQYTGGCVLDAMTASNYYTVAGCPSDSNPGVTTTVTYSYTFQGVSLATAQSAAFQTKCAQVVAAYAGVPASSVSITSVTAAQGGARRRRALLQSGGVTVNVAIRAAQGVAPSLKNILGYAGPAIGNALAVPFPGFTVSVGLLAAAPPPAPTSTTTWATPGAIAGVVVGGAVAVTLIVLLSVFIPRMRSQAQAQVFGHGYPHQMQQMQQVPPGDFIPSQQPDVQMGGKVASF